MGREATCFWPRQPLLHNSTGPPVAGCPLSSPSCGRCAWLLLFAPELAPLHCLSYPTPRPDLRSQSCGGIGKEDKAPEWSHLDLATFDRPRLCRSLRVEGRGSGVQHSPHRRCVVRVTGAQQSAGAPTSSIHID